MESDNPGILCFQHTKDEPKFFCFHFPNLCTYCQCDLMNTELNIPPFKVPYPFKSSSQTCNSIVVKPTIGDFLKDYKNSSNLHIGVTDSEGFVIEYDLNGIQRGKTENWDQCLAIQVLKSMTSSLKHHWNNILYKIIYKNCWKKERYDAEKHNCFSFVLSFLQSLHLQELDPFVYDKVIFCEHYLCPQTRIAAKYISLYRKLKQNSV